MNFLLEFTPEQHTQKLGSGLDLTDILTSGGTVVLTGLLTVFGVLTVLWLTLVAFKFFFHDLGANKIKATKVVESESAPVVNVPATSDDEIVAVIAAAIAMAESESSTGAKFRVVSFKRK